MAEVNNVQYASCARVFCWQVDLYWVERGGRLERERMARDLDASLSVFVNILGVVVFASITLYHVVTANRKDMTA